MRHRVAERLHLLVNSGELRSSFLDLSFDLRINGKQFDLPFGNEHHFAEALADGYDEKANFKSDPPGMFHCPPWTGVENSINRLWPIVAADQMIGVNNDRGGNQNAPIAIKGKKSERPKYMKMRFDPAARNVDQKAQTSAFDPQPQHAVSMHGWG